MVKLNFYCQTELVLLTQIRKSTCYRRLFAIREKKIPCIQIENPQRATK